MLMSMYLQVQIQLLLVSFSLVAYCLLLLVHFAGTDYNFTSSVYTFNSNINEHCASFVPIDDDIIEAPEVVAIQLSSNDPAVTFDIDTETVTITDNDSKILSVVKKLFHFL